MKLYKMIWGDNNMGGYGRIWGGYGGIWRDMGPMGPMGPISLHIPPIYYQIPPYYYHPISFWKASFWSERFIHISINPIY